MDGWVDGWIIGWVDGLLIPIRNSVMALPTYSHRRLCVVGPVLTVDMVLMWFFHGEVVSHFGG